MLEQLAAIDQALFFFINVTLANPVTNAIMPMITSDMLLRILYGAVMLLILWKGDRSMRWLVLFSLVTIALCDQTSSNLLKHMIERVRPCKALENVNLLVGCGSGFSMPSSHATNAFGQALLFAIFYRRVRCVLLITASLIAISRVFVGVHYPSDVIVGAALGSLLALIVAAIYNMLLPRLTGEINQASMKKAGD
ncbi:MAG: phosphatase PAP2 family protein [candidate division Zixibacteria bacterium]